MESRFLPLLLTLNNERGLVQQNYQCAGCGRPIGIIYGPAKVCGLTGGYYCPDCHGDDEAYIPIRVLINGDWSKRKVSRAVHQFLRDIEHDPVLDIVQFGCRAVYSIHPGFAALLTVRTRLVHLSAYLLSCRTGIGAEFVKLIWPRLHLYQQQHTYSLTDLPLVQSGQLRQQLLRLVQFGKDHVAECEFCTLKGFICEACHSDSVLFPFDLDSIYRCSMCGAVFHQRCMDRFQPCKRCQRWKKSQLEADVSCSPLEL